MFEQVTEQLGNALGKIFGSQNERTLRRLWAVVREDMHPALPRCEALSDEALRATTVRLRERLAKGETLEDVLPEAFAAVREASKRTTGLVHYDVQLIGGIVLHRGMIAEMATGEGKTLVATTAVYVNALTERGVHVVTVNDYLARRDTQWMGPIYDFLGLTIGCIQHEQAFLYDRNFHSEADDKMHNLRGEPSAEEWDRIGRDVPPQTVMRRLAYRADITYGTNNEFGFDYLRDNMKVRADDRVQRGHYYAVVDEVDNILVDEARTPLIISGPAEESTEKYRVADQVARRLVRGEEVTDPDGGKHITNDFLVKEKEHNVVLSDEGTAKAEKLVGVDSFYTGPNMEWPHHIEQALRAHHLYKRDHHYVAKDGEVIIVDEFTGRMMPGRRWSDGLHQAVETKEGLRIKEETQTYATITLQNYFKMYEKLAGMTGTAATEAVEFEKIYKLSVVVVPTHRTLRRETYPDVVFGTEPEKFDAIEEEIVRLHKTGRPVLVGTTSIEKSEHLSDRLRRRGIRHEVLNAKHHEREAAIVARAGQFGVTTIATNMAGRGTDILLGKYAPNGDDLPQIGDWLREAHGIVVDVESLPRGDAQATLTGLGERVRAFIAGRKDPSAFDLEGVLKTLETYVREGVAGLGGLHVLGTERHEARRIDNQLRGRAGRQGDPGSSQFFMSLDDELMRKFAPPWAIKWIKSELHPGEAIESKMVSKSIARAQKNVEAHNFERRKDLLEYDKVMNEQRKIVYGLRQNILEEKGVLETGLQMAADAVQDAVDLYLPPRVPETEWDLNGLTMWCRQRLGFDVAAEQVGGRSGEAVGEDLFVRYTTAFAARKRELGDGVMQALVKLVLLDRIDEKWKEHLHNMDQIRSGIGLRSYAQIDPKLEYNREARELFDGMMGTIREEVASLLLKVRPTPPPGWPPGPPPPSGPIGPAPVPVGLPALDAMIARMGRRWRGTEVERETVSALEGGGRRPREAPSAGTGGPPATPGAPAPPRPKPFVAAMPKVGRNDPCPCGSGKKFKKCHGQGG